MSLIVEVIDNKKHRVDVRMRAVKRSGFNGTF